MPDLDARNVDFAYPRTLREWCEFACTRSVVLRGLKFAVVVGTILIGINHGDAIMSGRLTTMNYVKMGLTVIVPYVVSVFSSVGALVESGRTRSSATSPGAGAAD